MLKRLALAAALALTLSLPISAQASPTLEVNLETPFQFTGWHSFVDLYASQKWGDGYDVATRTQRQTVYVPPAQQYLPSSTPNTIYQLSGVTMGARYDFKSYSVVGAFEDSEMFFDRETHGAFELTVQAIAQGLQASSFNTPSVRQWSLDLDSSYWFNPGGNQYEVVTDMSSRTGRVAVVGYDPDFAPFPWNIFFPDVDPLSYGPASPEAIPVDLSATVKLEMFYEAHDDLWNLARLDALDWHGALFTTYYYDLVELPEPSPVPVPASIVLLFSGVAGLVGIRKRRVR